MDILQKIIENKRQEVATQKQNVALSELKDHPNFFRESISLKQTLLSKSGIIAEFKRKSPSKGIINADASVSETVTEYQNHGASAVSVLTDETFFGGNTDDFEKARRVLNIPLLRKDFMIDEYQFYQAKAMGADVVLLIAACLSPIQVEEYTILSKELGLEVLLEIHTEEELKHYHPQVDFVGINNRNLKDFKVDLAHSVRLKNQLPEGVLSIAESGIYSVEDYLYLKKKGFDGFLMGEYFMKNQSPGETFETFIKSIEDEN